jgi:transcriptional regulator with XRE-family HTH domain
MQRQRQTEFHFVDVHVGKRIRRRREQLGMSQKRLAAAIDAAYQQIHKYETATNRVSPGCLYVFARLLNVPVAWFFDGLAPTATGRVKIVVPEYEFHSRETALLVEAYYRIADARRRRAVHRLIREIGESLSPRRPKAQGPAAMSAPASCPRKEGAHTIPRRHRPERSRR